MRKLYLDNIRWTTILLVLIYHVCYLFNGVGVPAGIPGAASIPVFDTFASIVYPWFMVLLFVVAGMSARYAMQSRSGKEFIKSRAVKLLVPSTLGLFVIHWITGYLNITMGSVIDKIPKTLLYPICATAGTGPLWFIQMLFFFSCVLVLLRKIDRADKMWHICERANMAFILLLVVPVFLGAQILNLPVLTTYRFGIYFVAFLIGYYIFSHESVLETIERFRILAFCLAVVCGVTYTLKYFGTNFASLNCLENVLTNLYLWFTVLAIIGCFKKYFNKETAFSRYMVKSSFGIYVLHYPVLISICYLLRYQLSLPAICNYVIALVIGVVVTFALYELIRRIPIIRFLVLGIKSTNKKQA